MRRLFRRLRRRARLRESALRETSASSLPQLLVAGPLLDAPDEKLTEDQRAARRKAFELFGVPMTDDGRPLRESAVEKTQLHSLLREIAATRIDDNGNLVYEVTMIREGVGQGWTGDDETRNYYTKEALQGLVNSGAIEGLKSYEDHPPRGEEDKERSIEELAGSYRNGRYVEENGLGRIRAEFIPVKGKDRVIGLIETALESSSESPLIGISMLGEVLAEADVIDGRPVNAVRELFVRSGDLVTDPGAGGVFERRLRERKLRECLANLNPASPGTATKESDMKLKPTELQEQITAQVAVLREAKDEESIGGAVTKLEELAGAEVEAVARESAEPEIPAPDAAATDELTAKLREAESQRDAEKARADEAEKLNDGLTKGVTAARVLREAKVDEADAKAWYPDLVKLADEDAMKTHIASKQGEEERIAAKVRESIFGEPGRVEGAGARTLTTPPAASRSLAGDLGIDADDLTPPPAEDAQ